jgi:hypothetical protein
MIERYDPDRIREAVSRARSGTYQLAGEARSPLATMAI